MIDPRLFAEPPSTYRGAYFWSINDAVDEREIRAQIDLMHRQGQGGVL